jgi:hypothetical protein
MPGPYPLQPLTVIEILDRAFAVYRNRFLTFFTLLAIVYLPINLALLGYLATHPYAFTSAVPRQARILAMLQQLLDSSAYGLAFTLAVGATTRAVGDVYLGERVSVGRSVGALLRILPRYLATLFLSNLLSVLGFLMLVIPGIVFSIWFAFASSVCVLEDRWGTMAMARSRTLARDHGGRIFVFFLLFGVLAAVLDGSVSAACEEFLPNVVADEWTRWALTNAASSVTTLLITPYFSIAWVLLYYDLRIRKEGFDLEVLAKTLISRRAEHPPGSLPS